MVLVVIAFLATAAGSLMSYALLGNTSSKTDFGQEVLTNSRIEHEENKSITSSFFFYFENEEHKIIIFVTCRILLFLVTLGCCLFFWGCCGFGCRKCT